MIIIPLKLANLIFAFGIVGTAYTAEQCPDLPTPIKFYKGLPGQMNMKQFSDMFQDLMSSISTLFQSLNKNNTAPDSIDFNSTDFSGWGNISWLNETGGIDNVFSLDSSEQTASVVTVASGTSTIPPTDVPEAPSSGAPLPANMFHLGTFLKGIMPTGQFGTNASAGDSAAKAKQGGPRMTFDLKLGSPQGTNKDSLAANQSLDTWGISVPLNTLAIEIAKLNNSQIVETYLIDQDSLKSNSNTDFKRFVLNVDLSAYNIEPNLFYVVCIKSLISQENEKAHCQKCVLLKPCDGLGCQEDEKILSFPAPSAKVHPYDALLHFFVYEPPVPNSSLVTRVQPRQQETRCPPRKIRTQSLSDQPAPFDKFERADRLYPNSILYVSVPNMSPLESYSVEGDLLLDLASASSDGSAPFNWSNPVVIGNYLGYPNQEYKIGACNRPF